MVETRQHTMAEQVESMISSYFSQGPARSSHQDPVSSSSPTAYLISLGSVQPPDPPDRSGFVQNQTDTVNPDKNKGSLLPNRLSSRLSKVGFPMFDGSKMREWIYHCNQFFSLDGTPPELKVRLVSQRFGKHSRSDS